MIRRYGTARSRSDRSAYSSIVRRRASRTQEASLAASIMHHWYHERSARRTLGETASYPATDSRVAIPVGSASAHCFLHERANPCLLGGGELFQREGRRPHGAFIEIRLVAEAQRCVSGLELRRTLEETDHVTVLGIRGHPVPEPRREDWRAGLDDGMEPLTHGAFRRRHLGELREHGAFLVGLVPARAAARR